jgi:acetoin utilization protein AcuB
MSNPIPTIQEFMTPVPVCIESTASIGRAHALLREHGIRHLPVLGPSGTLAGLVTDRDMKLAMSMNVHAADVIVSEVMRTGIYTVEPGSPLDEVAREMAAGKHGSAVVVQNRKVIGILTTVDVCRALADLLHRGA